MADVLKMTTGFGLFSSSSKVKIYFFLLLTPNLSYFNSFKLAYKIWFLAFSSPSSRSPKFVLPCSKKFWCMFPWSQKYFLMFPKIPITFQFLMVGHFHTFFLNKTPVSYPWRMPHYLTFISRNFCCVCKSSEDITCLSVISSWSRISYSFLSSKIS